MKPNILPLGVLLAACVPPARLPPAHDRPIFDPIAFFAGLTEGKGSLKIAFKAAQAIRVHGTGRMEGGSTLVLSQNVESDGKPNEQRQWRITRTAAGYTGVLSDADGPVRIEVNGARLHLAYRAKAGGFGVEQWLDLAADGRRADNILIFRKFGFRVARLTETIRKAG